MEPTAPAPTQPSEGGELDPDLAVGTMVGEYEVEAKIGQGGFGAVFKAAHPLIGKLVAIKVLSTRFSADKEMVSRFQAEARAVNQIRHQNIIDIFSFGQLPDRRHYYVMEFIDGEPLDRKIARGRLSLATAVPILRSIARALDAAHAKGIAHRDLKAENVFLGVDADGDPFPKLLDFGIAKLLGEDGGIAHKTRTGAPMGTPFYMSPEQTRGRDVDHRTDHYAFGVLTYLMLTQKYPLDGDDYMTILMRQVSDEPSPASTHVPDLPPRVDHTIAWLMRKEAAERPPDLMTAVRALEEVAGIPQSPSTGPVVIPSHVTTRPPRVSAAAPTVALGAPVSPVSSTSAATIDALPPSPRRSSKLALMGVAAAAIAIVVVFVVKSGSNGKPNVGSASIASVPIDAAPAIDKPVAIDAAVALVDAPAKPTMVTITLIGAPKDTEVRIGGQLYGKTPTVQVPYGETEVVLVLSKEMYTPVSLPITPARDQERAVKLATIGRTHGTGSGRGSGKGSGKPTDDILDFPPKKPGQP